MSDALLDAFLDQHPDIEVFEAILPDLAGGLRGKWVTRDKIHKIFEDGLKLPLSTLALDVWGRDPGELVFDSGDTDGICVADINTITPAPWLERPTGQFLLSMNEISGKPCRYDPRHVLKRIADRLEDLGLTAVLASEMEFHLFLQEDDHLGRPLHTQNDHIGGTLNSGQTYSIEMMNNASELMHSIYDACGAQNLPIDTLIKEAAPSQYEINLYHNENALLAADQAFMLKRAIKGVSSKYGLRANFMAKPFGEIAGNGMHIHCSLLDKKGRNAFNNNSDKGNALLRYAIAGCLDSMPDAMLLFAPNLNSFRRFQHGSHAPLSPTWGYENRTVSVRVPSDNYDAMRIEHRVSGADANVYLVMAAILAGMLHGIEKKLKAPLPAKGNTYEKYPATLPRYLPDAIAAFSESEFIKEYFGNEFRKIYTTIKEQELEEFDRVVTPLEYESNL